MAVKQYLNALLDGILFSIYMTFSPDEPLIYSPGPLSGMTRLLQEIGLIVCPIDDGFDVIGPDNQPVVRVRCQEIGMSVAVVVEPATVVFKALAVLGKPVQGKQE